MTKKTYKLRLCHIYQPKISLTEWGEPEIRHSNQIDFGEHRPDQAQLDDYVSHYNNRLGTTKEYEFGRKFEGKYGYRWTYSHFEFIETTITESITTFK